MNKVAAGQGQRDPTSLSTNLERAGGPSEQFAIVNSERTLMQKEQDAYDVWERVRDRVHDGTGR